MLGWWTGEYDNNEQIVRQSGGGLSEPTFTPHFRIHSHYRRVDMPDFGKYVVYVEEYRNNDPANLYRIRLMTLEVNSQANGIRVTLHTPDDPQSLIGGHQDLGRITKTRRDDWRTFSEGCTVLLRFEGNQFAGGMRSRACRIAANRTGEERDGYFDYRLIIGPGYYWFADRIRRLADDAVSWELAPGSPDFFQLDPVTWFSCRVNFNLEGDMTATEPLVLVQLHDQGGVARIEYPGGRDLSLVLHNRAFSTPTENRFRILRLHEDDNPVPLAYGYTIVPAERFGLNLGWFYTLCEPLEDLN